MKGCICEVGDSPFHILQEEEIMIGDIFSINVYLNSYSDFVLS